MIVKIPDLCLLPYFDNIALVITSPLYTEGLYRSKLAEFYELNELPSHINTYSA